jgi:hypothetical protein
LDDIRVVARFAILKPSAGNFLTGKIIFTIYPKINRILREVSKLPGSGLHFLQIGVILPTDSIDSHWSGATFMKFGLAAAMRWMVNTRIVVVLSQQTISNWGQNRSV